MSKENDGLIPLRTAMICAVVPRGYEGQVRLPLLVESVRRSLPSLERRTYAEATLLSMKDLVGRIEPIRTERTLASANTNPTLQG